MKPFYDAVKAMLPAGVKCHLVTPALSSPPVNTDYPYVLLWGSPGDEFSGEPEGDSLGDAVSGVELRIRATYVAMNVDSLSWLIGKCRPVWNRKAPTVPGYACNPLKQSALIDAQADTDLTIGGKHPLFAVDGLTLVASAS